MYIKISGKILFAATAAVLITAFSELPVKAESVFLKDGSILNGSIVSASDKAITIQMDDNELKQIPRKKILKILYTKLKTTTRNIQPDKPVIISVEEIGLNDRKITWETAADPDGIVVKYRIYGTTGDMRKMIGEVKTTGYLLKNVSGYDRVELASVDDKFSESNAVKVNVDARIEVKGTVNVEDPNTVLAFYPGVILPMGKSGRICNTGYGGMLTLTGRNFFSSKFDAGIGAGFYYAEGKDLLDEGKPLYHNFIIAPLFLNAGYRIQFDDGFSVIPSLSFGAAYINIEYMRKDVTTMEKIDSSCSFIDTAVKAGLNVEYSINNSISISLLGGYGMFIEMGGSIPFVIVSLGIEYRF